MLSFRSRVVIIVLGMVIGISSLLFTNDMARQLREKEQNEVAIWAAAFRELGADPGNPLLLSIITTRNNIPFILTDGALRVEYSHLIPDYILNHPNLLRDKLDQMTKVNPHLKVQTLYNETLYIFFDESRLLKTLVYFPYIQLLVIIVFVVFGYITFRSTKQDEQNPRLDRAGEGDGPPVGYADLFAARVARIPENPEHRPDRPSTRWARISSG